MHLLIWTAIITLFLSGCSTFAPLTPSQPPKEIAWKTREQQASQLSNWQIKGKIAVQTAKDAGSATIHWTQQQGQYSISLLGPLGANGLKLEGQPGRVTLETANGRQVTAGSPEQLLANQWGFNLPVSNLKYWIRGIPVPGMPSNSQFDRYHRLTTLTQGGSHIEYLSYTTANGIDLPQRMSISSPTIKTKIVIYEWNTDISH